MAHKPWIPSIPSADDATGQQPGSRRESGHQPSSRCWNPPTDLFETDREWVIVVEVAGLDMSQVRISVKGRHLQIRGQRPDNCQEHKVWFGRMEVKYGTFECHVEMPRTFDSTAIRASYQQGFLRITLPKDDS